MESRGANNDAPTSRDTVLRAFLFTDLVGSTAITAYLGVEAAERFRRGHFTMLQAQLDRFGGEEVKSVGDGVMATFASVHRALDAACAMQMSVHRAGSVAGHAVSMRIGLTVGDAVPHRGDYYGLAVNEASRLCNAAEGGEVLVSAAVALIGAPTDHRFSHRGPASLRGLPDPVEVHELIWPRDRPHIEIPMPARMAAEVSFRFVGRERAQLQLADSLEACRKSRRQIVLVGGEPGIGKTALVNHVVCVAAEAAEFAVLYGHCDEDIARPYGPFVEALAHVASNASAEVLEDLRRDTHPALFRLVPRLAQRLGVEFDPDGDPDADRSLLFDAVAQFLRILAGRCAVVLVLDDLHWADPATLALLRHLARSDSEAALAIVGTFRSTDIDETHPLSDTLAVLARVEGIRTIELQGFDDDEVCSLVAAAAGYDLDEDSRQVAVDIGQETAGNPYFIAEILRDLVERGLVVRDERGRWSSPADWRAGLPRTVRDVIVQRVQRLGQPVMRSLSAAAVFGAEFDPLLVAAAANVALEDMVESLDRAANAALVAESAPGTGRLRFAHGLVQRTLYEQLGVLRRQQLHRALAEALEASVASSPTLAQSLSGDVARHWVAAGRLETMAKAFEWCVRAGEAALADLAPEDAERWFRDALALLDAIPESTPRQRARTLMQVGMAQRQAGHAGFRETLLEAAQLARAHDQSDLLVAAVLANNRGIQSNTGQSDDARLAMLRAALQASERHAAQATDPAEQQAAAGDRARLMALSALEQLHVAAFATRAALADEALALARHSGQPDTIAYVLTVRHNAIRVPSTLDQRMADTEEAVALTEQREDLLARFWAYEHRLRASSEVPDLVEVDRCFERCSELANRLGQPGLHYYLAMHSAWRALLAGDLGASEAAVGRVRSIGEDTGQPETGSMVVAQLQAIRREQGRQSELEGLLVQAHADNPGIAALRSSVALLHVAAGRFADARAAWQADVDSEFRDMPYNTLWSTALVHYSDVARALGDRRAASLLYEHLCPFAGMLAHNSATCAGPIDRALAVLASTLDRVEDATAHFDAARACCERIEAPLWLARTQLDWVRTIPMSASEGRGRLRQARELAASCDAQGLVGELEMADEELEGA